MQHTSFRHIRRVLVWIIILVTCAVLANYYYSRYLRKRAEPGELAVLSSEMVQSARSIEYSLNRNGTLHFKIRAQKLIETRDGKNFLQGIQAFDFNPDGTVHNEIRSRNAEYDEDENNRTVLFTGDVKLFLDKGTELHTESLHYDLNTDIGATEDLVKFFSEGVAGSARGIYYDLNSKSLKLHRDVDFVIEMEKAFSDGSDSGGALRAVSERALFHENLSRFEFQGNAHLESESMVLSGDLIEAALDTDSRELTALTSTGNAEYRSRADGESRALSGDRMLFNIHSESRNLEKISVSGHAVMDFISPAEERRLSAEEIDLYLDPIRGAATRIDSRVDIRLQMKQGTEQTLISGERFHALFSPETQGLKRIDIHQHAKISMSGSTPSGGNEIGAEKIAINFREDGGPGAIEQLRAEGAAQWIARPERKGGVADPSSYGKLNASLIVMFYSEGSGFLDRIHTSGNVVMTEVSFDSGENLPTPKGTIDGHQLFADQARFNFYPVDNKPRDMYADGHVRIVYDGELKPGSSGMSEGFLASSDHMKAVFAPDGDGIVLTSISQWGNFRYEAASKSAQSGKCDYDVRKETMRLTDSPEIVFDMGTSKGELVEFDQKLGNVRIVHNVRSILSNTKESGLLGGASSGSHSIVLADEMQYHAESKDVRYSDNVNLLSEVHQLQAEVLRVLNNGAIMEAEGNVRHRISKKPPSKAESEDTDSLSETVPKEAGNSTDVPIYIKSVKLKYTKVDNSLIYNGNVSLRTSDLFLTSGILVAVLNEEGNAIEQATARNDVVITKSKIKCEGAVAYFFDNPERFEVMGTPAVCIDPDGVTTTGDQLTYKVADDSIQLGKLQY